MGWLKRWWPALAWAVVISIFSTSLFTSENTSRIIVLTLHWLFPHVAMSTLFRIHHIIRKCAHFTEYFVFSLLILRGIRAERREMRLSWAIAAIVIILAYSSLDEFHQSFVPGRGPAVSDVLLDTSGGTAGQIVAALHALTVRARQRRRQPAAAETRAQE